MSVGITKWVLRLSYTERTLLCHVKIVLSVQQCSEARGFKFKKYFTHGTTFLEVK